MLSSNHKTFPEKFDFIFPTHIKLIYLYHILKPFKLMIYKKSNYKLQGYLTKLFKPQIVIDEELHIFNDIPIRSP